MKKIIRRLSLSVLSFSLLLFSGCVNTGGGGGFDIVKFLQNKYVMIIGVLLIFAWMWSRSKK